MLIELCLWMPLDQIEEEWFIQHRRRTQPTHTGTGALGIKAAARRFLPPASQHSSTRGLQGTQAPRSC